MTEKPILFKAEMVRACLREVDPKGQTRRVVKPQPYIDEKWGLVWEPKGKDHPTGSPWYCERNANWDPITNAFADFYRDKGGSPYGAVGDRLWVKETHRFAGGESAESTRVLAGRNGVRYRADPFEEGVDKWRPSIFMPRWASRLTLEITGIRVERLQEIAEADARAEGCDGNCPVGHIPAHQAGPCVYHFAQLWDSINGDEFPWETSPWVWVIEFKRV